MSSVFKGLNRSDVYLTDYNSRRKWVATGSNLAELGIKLVIAVSSSRPYYYSEGDLKPFAPWSGTVGITSSYTEGTYNDKLVFGSIFESYYSGSLENGAFEGPKNLNLPASLTISGSRVTPKTNYKNVDNSPNLPDHQTEQKPTTFVVISIPKEVFGNNISEGSILLEPDKDIYCYVEDDYISHETGSYCDEGYPGGVFTREPNWVDPYFEDLHLSDIYDFEGVLLHSGFSGEWYWPEDYRYPTPIKSNNKPVGDVIYGQGQIIFTDKFLRYVYSAWDGDKLTWESNKPVFTEHISCKVRDIDFNRTFNSSATEKLQNTEGFTPYISTVGLYNTEGDLLAVAKLSKPIKKALDTEMTFDLQIDLG